jgi:hypothetical protein
MCHMRRRIHVSYLSFQSPKLVSVSTLVQSVTAAEEEEEDRSLLGSW